MKKSLILAIIILTISVKAMAHSIRIEVQKNYPLITVNASFSKISPMVNAKVEVISPAHEKLFQTGRTDMHGNFAFLPDIPGSWTIKINDEMGHAKNTEITISKDFFQFNKNQNKKVEIESDTNNDDKLKEVATISGKEIPLLYKVIFGLALIFGITGIFYGLKANKNKK